MTRSSITIVHLRRDNVHGFNWKITLKFYGSLSNDF